MTELVYNDNSDNIFYFTKKTDFLCYYKAYLLKMYLTYSAWSFFRNPSFDFEFESIETLIICFIGYYNPGHNILELHNILEQIRFTISKKKLDI